MITSARDLDNLDLAQTGKCDGAELEHVVGRVLVEAQLALVALTPLA